MSFVATAVIGAGVLGAGATIYGASKASDTQQNIANQEIANSQSQFATTNNNLAPFRNIGSTAADQLTSRLSDLTAPITMDESTLQNTPGYQFNLTQGLKGVTNSSAARGLGSSGAALKGAATFATGLADSTYQNQFNNANTNQTNAFNRLSTLVNTGENAAAGTGVLAQAATTTQNAALTGSGNAQAAADNAIGTSVSSAANNVAGYAAYKGIYGTPSSSGPSAGPITYGGPNGPVPFS